MLFLDPSHPRLPFGHLLPENEGVWGIPVDARRATPFRLPVTPADGNRRRLRIELAVDASGRLHGRGELVMSGHHALLAWSLGESVGQRYAAWVDWLRGAFEPSLVERVHLEELAQQQHLALHWDLAPGPRPAASDRADVFVNRPELAAVWPAQVEAGRSLPVVLPFAGRDELEVHVTWERGFEPDRLPSEIDLQNTVGRLWSRFEIHPAERRLVYQRTFAIDHREVPVDAFDSLRELLSAKLRSDADTIGLTRSDSRCPTASR